MTNAIYNLTPVPAPIDLSSLDVEKPNTTIQVEEATITFPFHEETPLQGGKRIGFQEISFSFLKESKRLTVKAKIEAVETLHQLLEADQKRSAEIRGFFADSCLRSYLDKADPMNRVDVEKARSILVAKYDKTSKETGQTPMSEMLFNELFLGMQTYSEKCSTIEECVYKADLAFSILKQADPRVEEVGPKLKAWLEQLQQHYQSRG